MPEIAVESTRFLGLAARYRVLVDGREVGRLGWRRKRVVSEVDPGRHTVEVHLGDRFSADHELSVGPDETATLDLIFTIDFGEAIARGKASGRDRLAGRSSTADQFDESVMALVRRF